MKKWSLIAVPVLCLCLLAGCAEADSPTQPLPTVSPTTETASAPPEETTQIPAEARQTADPTKPVGLANPWVDYPTMAEAEAAVGFPFSFPSRVADSYVAESFRVMDGVLMEVTYRDDEFEVTVRQQAGEGQDISGDYREYDTVKVSEKGNWAVTNKTSSSGREHLQLISYDGYSYSLYAPNGYWGDSNSDFLFSLYGEIIQ